MGMSLRPFRFGVGPVLRAVRQRVEKIPGIGRYNQGVLFHPRGAVFWPILKCGQTSWRDLLVAHGGFGPRNEPKLEQDPDLAHFAAVREPFDRYISALAQMWRHGWVADVHWRPFIDGVERWNRERPVWTCMDNPHFESQSARVRLMPNRELFVYTNIDAVRHWLNQYQIVIPDRLPDRNRTEQHMLEYAAEILSPEPVREFYADDMVLWNGLS